MNFKEIIDRLNEMINYIESNPLDLDKTLLVYEEAKKLLKQAYDKLEYFQQKIELIDYNSKKTFSNLDEE